MPPAAEYPEEAGELARLFEKDPDVIALLLFGSFARSAPTPLSDIDLCVITGPNLDQGRKEEILSHGSRNVDLHFFWDLPLPIQFRVIHEGLILVQHDRRLFMRIATDTVREYLDFEPFLMRHCHRAIYGRSAE